MHPEELTSLERRAMEMGLQGEHPLLARLREQARKVVAAEREISDGGFSVTLASPEVEPLQAPRNFHLLDLHARVRDIEDPVGLLLFVEEGRLARLEGQILGPGSWPEQPRLERLYFVRPRTEGSAELVESPARDLKYALGPDSGITEKDLDDTAREPIPRNGGPALAAKEKDEMEHRPDPSDLHDIPGADATQRIPGLGDAPVALESGSEPLADPPTEPNETGAPASYLHQTHIEDAMPSPYLPTRRLMYLVSYSVFLATGLTTFTVLLLGNAQYAEGLPVGEPTADLRRILLGAFLTVFLAGSGGGALANLAGLFRHNRDTAGFPWRLELPYYLRPLIGGLVGILVFLVFDLVVAALTGGTAGAAWATLSGRMVWAALATTAGFAGQELLEKLRLTARTLLSLG